MFTAIRSCWALLLGLGFLMMGNGLQGTLLGLRASLEGFSNTNTGLVMTSYFLGFVFGSILVPRMLGNVGHVRVFAALASIASVAILLHPVFVQPIPWMAMRLVTGFAYAGLYVVAESWLNDVATNKTRGQLLSIYMVVVMGGFALGQLLLNISDPKGFELFVLISVLVSIALVPILLTASSAPDFTAPEPISLFKLYKASPLGVLGMFSTGMAQGSVFGMGAVFAHKNGFSVSEVAYLLTCITLGGFIFQWPIGKLSDLLDRRRVIVATSILSFVLALFSARLSGGALPMFLAVMFLYGGISIPLYSLCIAHTNDFLQPRQMVGASSSLVLMNGLGAALGPISVAAMMEQFGPRGFLIFLAMVHGATTLFGLYRMSQRKARPLEDQRHYGVMAPRTSPILTGIASRFRRQNGGQEPHNGDE